MNRFLHDIKKLYRLYNEVEVPFLAAQTSFYVILAFFPFVVFILTLIQKSNLDDTLFMQALSDFLPSAAYTVTLQVLENARDNGNLFISIGGVIASLWPFSRAIDSLVAGVDVVYACKRRTFWRQLGLSFVLTAAFVLLIIVSIMLILFGRELGRILFQYLGAGDIFRQIWDSLRYSFSSVLWLSLFLLFYKKIPNVKLKVREVFPGAIFATILWLLLSSAFSFFMNRFFRFASIYGGLAGIILLLIWLYWAIHIILIGVLINATRHRCFPSF